MYHNCYMITTYNNYYAGANLVRLRSASPRGKPPASNGSFRTVSELPAVPGEATARPPNNTLCFTTAG